MGQVTWNQKRISRFRNFNPFNAQNLLDWGKDFYANIRTSGIDFAYGFDNADPETELKWLGNTFYNWTTI